MNLLSEVWYNYVSNFEDDYAIVEQNDVYNAINGNGNLISDQWYTIFDNFVEDFSSVYLRDKGWNYIDKNGELLSPNEWFSYGERFDGGVAKVRIGDGNYLINKYGILYLDGKCGEEMLEEEQTTERNRYLLMDVGGDFNAPFYNAVQYICETVHFPNSDFYTYEDESDLDLYEVDAVILLPNVWEKMLDYYVDKYGKYIDEGGKLYVINPETFELTLVNHSMELEDYKMSDVQQSLIVRR